MACLEAAHGNPKDPEMASGLDDEPDDNAKHAKKKLPAREVSCSFVGLEGFHVTVRFHSWMVGCGWPVNCRQVLKRASMEPRD